MSNNEKSSNLKITYLGATKKAVMDVLWENENVTYRELIKKSSVSRLSTMGAIFYLRGKGYIDIVKDKNGDNIYIPLIDQDRYEFAVSSVIESIDAFGSIGFVGLSHDEAAQLEHDLKKRMEIRRNKRFKD